eukprot:SAG31_NODE_44766_length_261_cov_0.950617_1_plen_29_part_10
MPLVHHEDLLAQRRVVDLFGNMYELERGA